MMQGITSSCQKQTAVNVFCVHIKMQWVFWICGWLIRHNKDGFRFISITVVAPRPPSANIWDAVHLKTPFTDFTTSRKMTFRCEPSQYGAFLVSLQAHSKTVLFLSGVKRRGEMLGAFVLWAPSQKGWGKERQRGKGETTQTAKSSSAHINVNLFIPDARFTLVKSVLLITFWIILTWISRQQLMYYLNWVGLYENWSYLLLFTMLLQKKQLRRVLNMSWWCKYL